KKSKGEDEEKGLYELQDEQEIEEEQRERMSAIVKTDFKVKSDFHKTLIKVDYSEEKEDEKEYSIKAFSSTALDRLESMNVNLLMSLSNMWEMSKEEKIQFTQAIVHKETKEVRESFQKTLQNYENECKQKVEIENQHIANILKSKKIIGVTITGASINHSLLKEIQPDIVIVEEAAEVLEPQLLASIGTWTKYMLMIGDHQQLRPPVDAYNLRKNFNFDLSMMERLIKNNMAYSTLKMQNRQRLEFAELLYDIYPGLQTNHQRVQNNAAATCLNKSSYFWHHTSEEKKDRSVTNPEEAKRAVKLALFLVQQGYKPNQITILATYRGQTALIRRMLKEYEKKYASLIQKDDENKISAMDKGNAGRANEETAKNSILIHTVDMYQGDENDFVIVSLVRSNKSGKIGFLGERNRRCVAQSRARCGVYFIGNADMFVNSKTWHYLIDKLRKSNRLGDCIHLLCKRHPDVRYSVKDSEELTLTSFCKMDCVEKMSCGKHICRKKCQPPHQHKPCPEEIQFTHLLCGHKATKKCEQNENDLKCQADVNFQFPQCGHPGKKKCSVDISTVICYTMQSVNLRCGHLKNKACWQDINQIKCEEKCAQKRQCGHACSDHKCFEHATQKECRDCIRIQEAEMKKKREEEEKVRNENERRIALQIEKLRKEARIKKGVEYIELLPEKETHTEYLDVEDRVKKYIQPGHNWYPRVEKIEKVVNRELRIKFLKCSTQLFDHEPQVSLKFHGTSTEGVDGIT
ncbi:MAG: DEAD/DEAH box helicase, partial [Bacteroidota bacterium]